MFFYIIWKNSSLYYYRISKMTYKHYYVGYNNQYGHEVVLIIPFKKEKHKFLKRFLFYVIDISRNLLKKL